MYIYLLTFFVSILLCSLSEYKLMPIINNSFEKKVILFLLFFLVALIPGILGGVRDFSIGTDIKVYGNIWFNFARESSSLRDYLNAASVSSIGSLYAFFNFIVSRFTSNPHWFYFWYCLVENIIVLLALCENKDIISITLGWATYLFIFYNTNFNMLRQGMALVILLLGFKYIRKKSLIKFLLVVLFAYLFHNTAIIGIVLYPLYQIIVNRVDRKQKILPVYIILSIFVFLFEAISKYLLDAGILSMRYAMYVNSDNQQTGSIYLFYLIILIFAIITQRSKQDANYIFFESILFICILFSAFVTISYLPRIISYYSIYLCFGIPYVLNNGNKRIAISRIRFNGVMVYVILVLYWIIFYGILNHSETVPFIFMTR